MNSYQPFLAPQTMIAIHILDKMYVLSKLVSIVDSS